MRGQPNGHTVSFRSKYLRGGEIILGYLEGWLISRPSGRAENHKAGQLILTNQRLCLYRKGLFGDQLDEIDLPALSSIEEVERSGVHLVRVQSNTDELIFQSTETNDIWRVVLDRLHKVRADPSWEPPHPAATFGATSQTSLPASPAPRFATLGRTALAQLIDRMAPQYELDELFVSPVDQSAIGLNFREKKVVLVTNARERSYRFDQIISVEASANDITLSQTNRGSQVMGAAIGGVLLGGTGLLLGGLTGSSWPAAGLVDTEIRCFH